MRSFGRFCLPLAVESGARCLIIVTRASYYASWVWRSHRPPIALAGFFHAFVNYFTTYERLAAFYASLGCDDATATSGDVSEAYSCNPDAFSSERFRKRLSRIFELREGPFAAETAQRQPDLIFYDKTAQAENQGIHFHFRQRDRRLYRHGILPLPTTVLL